MNRWELFTAFLLKKKLAGVPSLQTAFGYEDKDFRLRLMAELGAARRRIKMAAKVERIVFK